MVSIGESELSDGGVRTFPADSGLKNAFGTPARDGIPVDTREFLCRRWRGRRRGDRSREYPERDVSRHAEGGFETFGGVSGGIWPQNPRLCRWKPRDSRNGVFAGGDYKRGCPVGFDRGGVYRCQGDEGSRNATIRRGIPGIWLFKTQGLWNGGAYSRTSPIRTMPDSSEVIRAGSGSFSRICQERRKLIHS